jgi:hypothetical protein
VQNGRAYDKAVMDIGQDAMLVVSSNARIERAPSSRDVVEIFMEKRMSFAGHPPKPMSIRLARKYMGCARRDDTGRITVATYGEWGSREGGTSMRLLFRVPTGVQIETPADLNGEKSAGEKWKGAGLPDENGVSEGWWYGPAAPAKGWTAIASVPDPQMVAK